jgi:hypothetical protein
MSLSLSLPCLLTCSGPQLSLCTTHGPLLSLSRSPSVTAPTTTPCRGSALTVRRPGGRSDDHPTPRLRRPPCVVRRYDSTPTTTPSPGDCSDDEEALRCAALERLPTHPARHRGLPPGLLPQVLTQPPISLAHRLGLLPHLRARRRAQHWRMGTATL